jgi:hypothetical protein
MSMATHLGVSATDDLRDRDVFLIPAPVVDRSPSRRAGQAESVCPRESVWHPPPQI